MIGRRAALLALPLAALARPAAAGCLIFCDEAVREGAEATAAFTALLGSDLPEGATVTHLLEGGFQDGFVQVRLDASPTAADTLLARLGTARDRLQPGTGQGFGATAADWWPEPTDRLLRGEVRLAHFAFAEAALAGPGGGSASETLFLFAFET
jgi:hypothetical protein